VQNSFDALTGRMLNVCATNHSGACDGDVANISTGFDAVGNLLDRGDTLHGIAETFAYDPLNRLTAFTVSGGSTNLSRAMTYDSAGDITKKSDAGTYSYTGAQPHAVSSITGTIDGLANPHFFYDLNGNMACMTSAAQCDQNAAKTVAWTSFNMVAGVKQGTTAIGLLYDPEHARAQQTATEGTTLYLNDASLGAMAERFQPITGAVTWRNYITVDGHIVAERTTTGATVHVRYFVLDHLGSTAALTDETGALAESDAYDAWGKQRNAATGADDTTCSVPAQSFSNRGYTGHEQLGDGLCLVNMNARIYDPTIGRFMSPDDMIPDAYNGQNFNRYTYVDDNPLSYTDPTGHTPCSNCDKVNMFSAGGGPTKEDRQFCLGCRGDYDTTEETQDQISHQPSIGLTSGQTSASGLALGATQFAAGGTGSGMAAQFGGDTSPGMSDPVAASPQNTLAQSIDSSNNPTLQTKGNAPSDQIEHSADGSTGNTVTLAGGGRGDSGPGSGDYYIKDGKIIIATDDFGKYGAMIALDKAGRLIIVAHGDPNYLYHSPGNGRFDFVAVANMVTSSGLFHGQDILLIACNTGVSPVGDAPSFAQLLANKLHVTVYAPPTWVFVTMSSKGASYFSAPSDDPRQNWQNASPATVTPNRSQIKDMKAFSPISMSPQ
jgi:RHS repeat-associated protein